MGKRASPLEALTRFWWALPSYQREWCHCRNTGTCAYCVVRDAMAGSAPRAEAPLPPPLPWCDEPAAWGPPPTPPTRR